MSDLILRAIKVERLPDDEQDEDWKSDEVKPKPRGLLHKIKSGLKGSGANSAAKLSRALAELRKIEQRRLEFVALDQAENQVASELLSEYQSSIPGYNKGASLEEFKESYRAYLVAIMETLPKIEWLRTHIGGQTRVQSINRGQGGDIEKLKSEFPSLKQTLADAICAKAAQLNMEAEKVAKDEQQRLDAKCGSGRYDSEDQSEVKNARAEVERAKSLIARVQVEPVESCYNSCVEYLLP